MQSQIFWEVDQLLGAFLTSANSVILHEIPDTIRIRLTTDRITSLHSEIVDHAFQHLEKLQERSHKYASLTRELQAIALLLETEKMSFKTVKTLAQRTEVGSCLERLRTAFEEDLKKYQD